MHRTGQSRPAILTVLMVWLAGCAVFPAPDRPSAEFGSIFVHEPAGAVTDELRLSGEVSHDAAVRRLRSLGYRAAAEPAEADATLEGVWIMDAEPLEGARRRVTLRLTLKSRRGDVLFTTQVLPGTLLSFLSKDRVAEEVDRKLSELGAAPFVR